MFGSLGRFNQLCGKFYRFAYRRWFEILGNLMVLLEKIVGKIYDSTFLLTLNLLFFLRRMFFKFIH